MFLHLELSLVAYASLTTNFVWPLLHIMFRSSESILMRAAQLFTAMDDVSRSINCDLAATYCARFGLRCDQQCSFTSLALERLRQSN